MLIWETFDWKNAHQEALEHLKALIRFETVNPPGNEKPAAEYLAEVLRKEELEPEIIESAPNRANLICRIRGNGTRPPILLNGHLDVVSVEGEKWQKPPFEALVEDGVLYGRGAIDMKNMVTMCLMCMVLFKRSGITLKRDLIFCAVADEEAGGEFGARFMVNNHPDKLRAEYAIGEMGGFSLEIDGKRFYPVQVAEKGFSWLRIKTRGDPGHGSIPEPNSALTKAAVIAAKLSQTRLPQHNTESTINYFTALARQLKFPKNRSIQLLLNPRISGFLLDNFFPDKDQARILSAMLHNTANPTGFNSGTQINVIPSEAHIEVDGRVLPGFSSRDLIAEVRRLIGEEPEIEIILERSPTVAPINDPIMTLIEKTLQRHDSEAIVLPNLLTGVTDASHWKDLGIKCYGFSPLKLPSNMIFKDLVHGHDEGIPLDGFRFGLEVLFETVAQLAL